MQSDRIKAAGDPTTDKPKKRIGTPARQAKRKAEAKRETLKGKTKATRQ